MTMIASVLHLDRKAVKELRITDPYSLHRVVYSLYDDVRSDKEKQGSTASGILFADQGGDVLNRKVLLLADRPPANCLEGGYGEVQSKAVPDDFLDYERYRFQVVVNPTRRDSATRKLLPVKGRDAIKAWFCERAEKSWGFQVSPDHLQVDQVNIQRFKDKAKNPVTIAQASLQGELQVIDPEQFKTSFRLGIGRARAFGCGLLQIVPITDTLYS
ncbi:type I-E CRISPR-associated protein Cas6/Cse3/CasE [Marinobacter sp. MMG032]|uniref:Type I-E CRISPR-associated protein Cas6/Cse3/CasE n=1 Tax=Marinobacter sp. MMG032 TaxID=3158548 RepID=A0AAU7MQ99_9GAMM